MLFIILLILGILAVIGTFLYNTVEYDLVMGLATAALACIISGIVGLLLFIGIGFLLPDGHTDKISDHTVKRDLTSLSVQQHGEINGNFYLGSRTVSGESEPGYTYMYKAIDKNEQTYYKLDTVDANDSRIYERETANPSVTIRTRVYETRDEWLLPFPISTDVKHDYTFTVPEGSVVQNYQAN